MSDTPRSAAATIVRWRAAAERGDVDAAIACLSRDVVLSSPLTEQFRLEGSEQLRDFLTSAFTAVEDIRYHTQTGEADDEKASAIGRGAASDSGTAGGSA